MNCSPPGSLVHGIFQAISQFKIQTYYQASCPLLTIFPFIVLCELHGNAYIHLPLEVDTESWIVTKVSFGLSNVSWSVQCLIHLLTQRVLLLWFAASVHSEWAYGLLLSCLWHLQWHPIIRSQNLCPPCLGYRHLLDLDGIFVFYLVTLLENNKFNSEHWILSFTL